MPKSSKAIRDELLESIKAEFSRGGMTFTIDGNEITIGNPVDMEAAARPGAFTTRPGGKIQNIKDRRKAERRKSERRKAEK